MNPTAGVSKLEMAYNKTHFLFNGSAMTWKSGLSDTQKMNISRVEGSPAWLWEETLPRRGSGFQESTRKTHYLARSLDWICGQRQEVIYGYVL